MQSCSYSEKGCVLVHTQGNSSLTGSESHKTNTRHFPVKVKSQKKSRNVQKYGVKVVVSSDLGISFQYFKFSFNYVLTCETGNVLTVFQ